MRLIFAFFVLTLWQSISFGFFDSKYNIKLTSESEIENCLSNLTEIGTYANILMLSKGGFLKITEISAEVSKEARRVKCNYVYTASGVLNKQDGKQEQIAFKGRAFGDCIKK